LPRIGHGADLPAMLGRENHSMQYVCQLILPVDGIMLYVYSPAGTLTLPTHGGILRNYRSLTLGINRYPIRHFFRL
jgi:hypothetical protein